MCTNCSQTKQKYWVFGCGTFFLLSALLIGLIWPIIAASILHKNLELRQGSLNFNNWIETPIPMYLKITMFNWTNPEEIHNSAVKPHFEEVGPYVFLERHYRRDINWNAENNTLSYYQNRVWHFVPEKSNGSLSDKITNINVMASAVAYNVRDYNKLYKYVVNQILRLEGSLTVTKTVGELLFDGYDDPILKTLKVLNLPQFKVPFNKFGWFVERNDTPTYDGRFEIRTGHDDITKVGIMTKWNYSNRTKFYRNGCSDVNGTSGELWPVDMDPTADITLFISDLCHSMTLSYEQQHTRFGVTGSRWVGDEKVFDNGEKYPENACYCTGPQSSCPDLLYGVQNISDCRFGAPVFASFPHFYLADPTYVNAVSGLAPNRSQHQFSLSLEPNTGIPLDVNARLQINILLQPISGITIFKNVPKVMIPAFWFEQSVELDETLAKEVTLYRVLTAPEKEEESKEEEEEKLSRFDVNWLSIGKKCPTSLKIASHLKYSFSIWRQIEMALELPSIGIYVAYGISGLGSILIIVGIVATLTKRWNNYDNLDDELTN